MLCIEHQKKTSSPLNKNTRRKAASISISPAARGRGFFLFTHLFYLSPTPKDRCGCFYLFHSFFVPLVLFVVQFLFSLRALCGKKNQCKSALICVKKSAVFPFCLFTFYYYLLTLPLSSQNSLVVLAANFDQTRKYKINFYHFVPTLSQKHTTFLQR